MVKVDAPITRTRVLAFLDEYRTAYESGSPHLFDLFSRDATVFTASSKGRVDSLEELRRWTTESGPRRSQLSALEVRELCDAALVTFHNRVTEAEGVTNLRTTLLIVARGSELKVAHMHSSALPQPTVAGGEFEMFEDIAILEERVATAAASVGTPK
jgi:hypothetical protein